MWAKPCEAAVADPFAPLHISKTSVWMLEFAFDQAADPRVLPILMRTDAFAKTALASCIDSSITGDDLVRIRNRLTAVHEQPRLRGMAGGAEMICNAVGDWYRFSTIGSIFIEKVTAANHLREVLQWSIS